ncbi:50S ribosome-binding GTPase [Rhizoctonia solani]|uniref:50S ribosome-binding GTPase n=1 Tax=Rhizoctonia solani TaxID=456999 RepID=A0A8H7H810_9AGAM|nr:50S ribosome-binding GTPase [Rhizoctonia solani]
MQVGNGLRSSTKHLESSKIFQVDGQPVVVVDCPGFNDTELTETEILRRLAEFLVEAYTNQYQIIGMLYVHKISDTRVGGTSFRHMNMFKALCGPKAFKNVVYVTNMWSIPPTEDEILRETELRDMEFFGTPLAEGAQMARHTNTQESAHNIIRMLLGKDLMVTKIQRQLVDESLPLEKTDVGLVIGQDLEDNLRKRQEEMSELMAQRQNALEANDQNWLRLLDSQEERARIKESQLLDQLQVLRTSETKPLNNTSLQVDEAQFKTIIDSDLALFQAQIEAMENKSMGQARARDKQLADHLRKEEEQEKQRDKKIDDEIARMKATTTSSYAPNRGSTNAGEQNYIIGSRSSDKGGIVSDIVGWLGDCVTGVYTRIRDHDRSTSSKGFESNYHSDSEVRSSLDHYPSTENVGNSYGSSRWAQDSNSFSGKPQNKPLDSKRHRTTHNRNEGYGSSSERRSQTYKGNQASSYSNSPSNHE